MRCDPADTIIRKFNGLTVVADVTGVTIHSVMRWRRPRELGGTGGLIPSRHIAPLMEYARMHALPVTADDFIATTGEAA